MIVLWSIASYVTKKNERVDRTKNGPKRRPLPTRDTVDEAFRDPECAGDTVDEAFRDSGCAGDTVAKREMDKKMRQKGRNRPE